MSMLHQARARRKGGQDAEGGQDVETSPVKTVLGSLTVNTTQNMNTVTNKTHADKDDLDNKKPVRIEDVPFRRQDRRILNARYRRLMDKKLIIFIVSIGLLLICLGSVLIALYSLYQEDYKHIRPFLVIGPVLIGGGLITLLCSVEVCIRLYKSKKRVQDPELDNLINPHEVKHWMDPKLIPFGWGLFAEDDDEVLVLDKASTNYILGRGKPGSASRSLEISAGQLDSVIDIVEEEDDGERDEDVSAEIQEDSQLKHDRVEIIV